MADPASARIESLELELSNTKERLAHANTKCDFLAQENRTTMEQLRSASGNSAALGITQGQLAAEKEKNGRLEKQLARLKSKTHPKYLALLHSSEAGLRFIHQSGQLDYVEGFAPIPGRGPTDVEAIRCGSGAAHSGYVLLHAYCLHFKFQREKF